MRLTLFWKFFLILSLLAALPSAIVGWRTVAINRTGMQGAILELHTNIAANLADDIQTYITTLNRETTYAIKTLGTRPSWDDRQTVLQSLLDNNDDFVSISIVNKRGKELFKAYNPDREKNPRLLDLGSDKTYAQFWDDSRDSIYSSVYFVEGDPRINIMYPYTDEYSIFSNITLHSLWEKVTNIHFGSTGYAFLVNKHGTIIAHPDFQLAEKHTSAKNLPIVSQVLTAVAVGSSEYRHPDTNKKFVGAYAPIPALSWGVIIQQDQDEAFISVHKMRIQAIVLTLISIAAAALLALFVAQGLTSPLRGLTLAAQRIARKDFTARVPITSNDEFRDLAETFNRMTAALQQYDEMQVDKLVTEKTKTDAVIFSIADGILMTDNNGKIQLANARARDILQLPEGEIYDTPLEPYLANDEVRTAVHEVLSGTETNTYRELELTSGAATTYFKLSSQDVMTPQKNENIGIVTVMRNVTLEKELERMKDDFLHSITHDLRNPMTSIRGFLKFLIDGVAGEVNPQQRKMLDTMDRASRRLLNLINDILDVAKMESGRVTLNIQNVDLRNISQRSLDVGEGQAMRKEISLVLDAPDPFPMIRADAELLDRVLTNLVGNAIKFTPDKGKITVKLTDEGESIRVSVNDTGDGIPQEFIATIFDKYKQVEGQHKGGTGLGLTICKYIVEAHGGTIWAESAPHKGSSFIFTLPKQQETT